MEFNQFTQSCSNSYQLNFSPWLYFLSTAVFRSHAAWWISCSGTGSDLFYVEIEGSEEETQELEIKSV